MLCKSPRNCLLHLLRCLLEMLALLINTLCSCTILQSSCVMIKVRGIFIHPTLALVLEMIKFGVDTSDTTLPATPFTTTCNALKTYLQLVLLLCRSAFGSLPLPLGSAPSLTITAENCLHWVQNNSFHLLPRFQVV